MSLGERIKKRRCQLGLSVNQVSKMIDEPASSYLEWENGRKITGEKVYPKLAVALRLSLSELITGGENPASGELNKIQSAVNSLRQHI